MGFSEIPKTQELSNLCGINYIAIPKRNVIDKV